MWRLKSQCFYPRPAIKLWTVFSWTCWSSIDRSPVLPFSGVCLVSSGSSSLSSSYSSSSWSASVFALLVRASSSSLCLLLSFSLSSHWKPKKSFVSFRICIKTAAPPRSLTQSRTPQRSRCWLAGRGSACRRRRPRLPGSACRRVRPLPAPAGLCGHSEMLTFKCDDTVEKIWLCRVFRQFFFPSPLNKSLFTAWEQS